MFEEDIKERIINLEHKVNGNGRPGIVERLSKIESKMNLLIWLCGAVAVPTLLNLITILK